MTRTKRAGEIQIGDSVVERDGALLTVVDVFRYRNRVILTCESLGPSPRRSADLKVSAMVRVAEVSL